MQAEGVEEAFGAPIVWDELPAHHQAIYLRAAKELQEKS